MVNIKFPETNVVSCVFSLKNSVNLRLKRMKAALVKERKCLEEQVTWDLIAEKSPEFAALLKAFRDAGGEL